MPIKFAFSTVACPDWTLRNVAERAKEMGFDGVDLRTLGPGSAGLSCDPALSEPSKVSQILSDAGIEPICLSTSLALHYKDVTKAHRARFDILRALDDAAEIGCGAVRIFGNEVRPGEDHRSVISRITSRMPAIADKAGQTGVQLLFENAGSFPTSKE